MIHILLACLSFALGYLLGQKKDTDVRQAIYDDIDELEIEFTNEEIDLAESIAKNSQQGAVKTKSMDSSQQIETINNILNK